MSVKKLLSEIHRRSLWQARGGRHGSFLPTLCLLATMVLGCAGETGRQPGDESTLTILSLWDEHVLGLPYDMLDKFLVFLPLAAENEAGELEGRLAQSWEHSDDWRAWTIFLRSDIRWHDGVPVTAHDVKFTLDLMKRPDVLWADPDAFEVRVLDDTSYTITYRKPSIGNPLDSWTVYYPKHLLEGLDTARWMQWEFWTRPVGNGPYRYVRHVAGTLLELEANPDFYMGRPRIDRVVLKFGGQPVAELLSGNVDVVQQATEADLLWLADDPRFRIYQGFAPHSIHAIVWNQRHPAFRDPRVRRALTQAVDREELLRVLNLPEDTPVLDVLFTVDQFRRGELPAPLPYDPEEASRLLEEAGWQDTDDDGIRQRGGRPFEFSALVGPLFGLERAAVYIQSQLRRVGIRMEVETLEILALFERVTAREFDAVIADIHTRGDRGAGAFHFEEDSPIGYANPRVGSLLRQKGLMFDRAEVDSIYRELWPIFQADLPVTFLFPIVHTTIAHRRVRGLASPSRIDPVSHIEQLWVEEEH